MMYISKVQGNVFAFLQIFNAIPPSSFSAPAELRMISPTADPYVVLILISHPFTHRAQCILGVRRCRMPSKDGSGRLNLQCRSKISLHLDLHFISRHFGTKTKIWNRLCRHLPNRDETTVGEAEA
jgi:hypothetical protein